MLVTKKIVSLFFSLPPVSLVANRSELRPRSALRLGSDSSLVGQRQLLPRRRVVGHCRKAVASLVWGCYDLASMEHGGLSFLAWGMAACYGAAVLSMAACYDGGAAHQEVSETGREKGEEDLCFFPFL